MAELPENKMIDIISELNLKNTAGTGNGSGWAVPVTVLAAVAVMGIIFLFFVPGEENVTLDFEPYAPYDNVDAVIEARYEENHNTYYSYGIEADGDIILVRAQGVASKFVVTKVWYGNSVWPGEFTVENTTGMDCEAGKTYVLFICDSGEYIQDFYPIDSPAESVKKESRYSIAEPGIRLIEKHENGSYIMADGQEADAADFEKEMNAYIKRLTEKSGD